MPLIRYFNSFFIKSRTSLPLLMSLTIVAFLMTLVFPVLRAPEKRNPSSLQVQNEGRESGASVQVGNTEHNHAQSQHVHESGVLSKGALSKGALEKSYRLMDVEIYKQTGDLLLGTLNLHRHIPGSLKYRWVIPDTATWVSGTQEGTIDNVKVGNIESLQVEVAGLVEGDVVHLEAYFEDGQARYGSSGVYAFNPNEGVTLESQPKVNVQSSTDSVKF